MAGQVIMLNRVEGELPSLSDVAKTSDIELQEIMENAAKSTENLIAQLDDQMQLVHPLHELLELDKALRSIWGSLEVETAKKVQLHREGKGKLSEIKNNPEYNDAIQEDIESC